jgi:general secretion pathway protein N
LRWPLAAVAAVLAVLVGYEWLDWPPKLSQTADDGNKPSSEGVPNAKRPANPLDLVASLEDREQYAVIMERPLFLPDRRPPADEPDEPAAQTPEPDANLSRLDLSAVLIAPGETFAWVRDPTEKELLRLRPGDELKGWQVQQILDDRLVLERQGETDTLILRDYKNAPPPVPLRPPRAARQPTGAAQKPNVPPRPGATNARSRVNESPSKE